MLHVQFHVLRHARHALVKFQVLIVTHVGLVVVDFWTEGVEWVLMQEFGDVLLADVFRDLFIEDGVIAADPVNCGLNPGGLNGRHNE